MAGPKSRGMHKKTWDECASRDLRSLNLKAKWAQDRSKWRAHLEGTIQTVSSEYGTTDVKPMTILIMMSRATVRAYGCILF